MHLGHYCELSEAVCQIALRSCSQRGERETRICRNFGWGKKKKKTSIEYQKIITNHKEKTSQVKDFSVFLCLGSYRYLGSLKFFLRYASYYLRACLSKAQGTSSCFFILNSPQGTVDS